MKKVFLTILVLGTITMTSCGDEGRDVDAQDAQDVIDNTTETTVEFNKIAEGSKVNFTGTHIGGAAPRVGSFLISEGSVKTTDNVLTNGSFSLNVSSLNIDVTSVDNKKKKAELEGHLKSADFFNDSLYPSIKFELTEVANEISADSSFTSKLTGNLTLLDSTKSVSFYANITVNENEASIKSEKFAIDRTQWGLVYGSEGLENAMISNAVSLEFDITLTK
jgi:polyisoprenoid-binding protein YceI